MMEDKPINLRSQSVFAPYIKDFVEQKQSLGLKYNAAIETLNMFDSFCAGRNITDPTMTDALYSEWCRKRPTENETTHHIRVGYVRQFSKYLCENGIKVTAALHLLPRGSKAFVPYIFSEEEIRRFMSAVDQTNEKPNPGSPIRHLVHPALFRTLYGCGLRANEALKLKTEDVDLESGSILIRAAKGGKDRMVVMSDSLLHFCQAYRSKNAVKQFESDYFFPARDHGYYDSSTVYEDFRKYLKLSGIPHRGRGNGPRLHDFRHTFAVHVLNNWAKQGKDLYVCLPILQRYLGHASIAATEKYLQLVPEAYTQVIDPYGERFGHIFPEVADEEK